MSSVMNPTLLDWYRRIMLSGKEIPKGVTINLDGRSDQACRVCDELVDANGYPFTAETCSLHTDVGQ